MIRPDQAAEQLGPEGPGFAVYNGVIPELYCRKAVAELNAPDTPWYRQYNQFTNQRGVLVVQRFEVFAHKISRGSQEDIDKRSYFHSLGSLTVEKIARPLANFFPNLKNWKPDEIAAQRYNQSEGHLSWHKDLERHPGIIAICNIVGAAVLGIKDGEQEHHVKIEAGDVLVLRAPKLFDSPDGKDLRPEHAVISAHGDENRISVTVRANDRPTDYIANFHYHNWRS